MSKLLQLRGGTTSEHGSFTGAVRETTVDTTKDTLVVHDGSTAGGFPLARESALTTTTATAAAALPKAGGTMTGGLAMGANTITSTGKILFSNMYAQTSDLPSATTYHGMFAHVHATGQAYYAHGGAWVELAKQSDVTTTTNTSGAALPKAGGAMTGAITTNSTFDGRDVGTDGTKLDTIYPNIPKSGASKTASYTLATTDIGELIECGSSGAIVIPNSTFATGDAVLIFNNTSGNITLTCSVTTAFIGGANANASTMTLATRGICNVLFISGTVCVVTGNVT